MPCARAGACGEVTAAGDRIVAFTWSRSEGKRAADRKCAVRARIKGLLEKLFEQEVPRFLYEKSSCASSRAHAQPGARAQEIAVSSRDPRQSIPSRLRGHEGLGGAGRCAELRGEKIDIVPYSEDPASFG